jgi:hypothetical protein
MEGSLFVPYFFMDGLSSFGTIDGSRPSVKGIGQFVFPDPSIDNRFPGKGNVPLPMPGQCGMCENILDHERPVKSDRPVHPVSGRGPKTFNPFRMDEKPQINANARE